MIVIFKQLNFCPKMQQILELLAQMKIEGWIYWNWVPTVEFRYLQFAEIRQLSRSVNFRPDRLATEKVSELDRDFGYPTIVRRPERVSGVKISIGKCVEAGELPRHQNQMRLTRCQHRMRRLPRGGGVGGLELLK
ncbi:uncharacterized protein LOC110672097 isoform X3 [Hevea brasiliensis]|uniref:uncharacterized protein LOC110672097 isoform X3 n=1 Tax=Hevea brasiliensis TaxID=3981 RepID=UPI0025D348CA|nr:uncharacterized protein LOC110672097 isoform X3 [Hevea brasiliensis]